MTQVDRQIDLVVLGNVENVLLVLHVHRHEFVADLGCMLRIVDETELFRLDVQLQLGVVLKSDAFALNLLAPPIFVEALSEEDHVREHCFVVELVYPIAHAVQIQSKDLVHKHLLAILGAEVVVVTLPLAWVGSWRKSCQGWKLRVGVVRGHHVRAGRVSIVGFSVFSSIVA